MIELLEWQSKYGEYEKRFRQVQKRTGKKIGMLEEKPKLNLIETVVWNIFLKLHNRRQELNPIGYHDLKIFFEMEGYKDCEVKRIIKNAIFEIDNVYIQTEVEKVSKDIG